MAFMAKPFFQLINVIIYIHYKYIVGFCHILGMNIYFIGGLCPKKKQMEGNVMCNFGDYPNQSDVKLNNN